MEKIDAESAGVRWIEPETFVETPAEAEVILRRERQKLKETAASVVDADKNKLRTAGTSLLRLRPKVTAAARVFQEGPEALFLGPKVDATLAAIDTADLAIGYVLRADKPTFVDVISVIDALNSAEKDFDSLLTSVHKIAR